MFYKFIDDFGIFGKIKRVFDFGKPKTREI